MCLLKVSLLIVMNFVIIEIFLIIFNSTIVMDFMAVIIKYQHLMLVLIFLDFMIVSSKLHLSLFL